MTSAQYPSNDPYLGSWITPQQYNVGRRNTCDHGFHPYPQLSGEFTIMSTEDTQTTQTTDPQTRVWQAADALASSGQRVTVRAVRTLARIDAKEVQEHLPGWRAEQEASAADSSAAPPVPQAARAAFDRAWSAAWAEAEAAHKGPLADAETRIAKLERQLSQLEAEAEAAETEASEARQGRAAAEAAVRDADRAAAASAARALTEEKARARAEARAEMAEASLKAHLEAQARNAEEERAA